VLLNQIKSGQDLLGESRYVVSRLNYFVTLQFRWRQLFSEDGFFDSDEEEVDTFVHQKKNQKGTPISVDTAKESSVGPPKKKARGTEEESEPPETIVKVKKEPGVPAAPIREKDEVYDHLIRCWIKTVQKRCKETTLKAASTGRPRPPDKTANHIVFDDSKRCTRSKDCPSLPKETTMLLHDLMSLGAFSVWLFHPLAFSNDINGLFEAIFHFLEVHCELEGLKRADLYNVYHHYCHGREPTIYHRYK
jgi:hypothetical protein